MGGIILREFDLQSKKINWYILSLGNEVEMKGEILPKDVFPHPSPGLYVKSYSFYLCEKTNKKIVTEVVPMSEDPKGRKKIRIQYGILIPKNYQGGWSEEVYSHNDKVGYRLKSLLRKRLKELYNEENSEELFYALAKLISGYGYSSCEKSHVLERCNDELESIQNWWLNEIYPDIVLGGFFPSDDILESLLGCEFIGY